MKTTIAIAQTPGFRKTEQRAYVDATFEMIRAAAAGNARLLVLPQAYPGGYLSESLDQETLQATCNLAKSHGMAVIYGSRKKVDESRYQLTAITIDNSGTVVGEYARTSPRGPFWYPSFGLDYVGGDVPPSPLEVGGIKIAVVMCAEIFLPELSRVAALQGVDLIANPACLDNGPDRWPVWQSFVQARALENLCYVAACQTLRRRGRGLGMIAGPAGSLARSQGVGVTFADIDVEFIRELQAGSRERDPGKVRAIYTGGWDNRRPELYQILVRN